MFNILNSCRLGYRVPETDTLADPGVHEGVEHDSILVHGRDYTSAVSQLDPTGSGKTLVTLYCNLDSRISPDISDLGIVSLILRGRT